MDFGNHGRGLAAVLAESGARSLLGDVRGLLREENLTPVARANLHKALVVAGEEADLRLVLESKLPSAELLEVLAERDRPGFDPSISLRAWLLAANPEVRAAAIRLVGWWRVQELRPEVLESARDSESTDIVSAAISALGQLGGDSARDALQALASDGPGTRRSKAIVALLEVDPGSATRLAGKLLAHSREPATVRALLNGFSGHRNGLGKLAAALGQHDISLQQGQFLHHAWIASGHLDELVGVQLAELAGADPSATLYRESQIPDLVALGGKGDAARGRDLFRSAALGCAACHKVEDAGGQIGPDLSGIGSGVPPERIVAEVLWPASQVKEGFSLSRLTLRDGRVHQGYLQSGAGQVGRPAPRLRHRSPAPLSQ